MTSRTARVGILIAFIAVAVALFVFLQDSSDDSEDSGETTATEEISSPEQPAEPPREVIQMRGGEVVGGAPNLTYVKGDRIRITVELDEPQEDVHIHGYDIEVLNPQTSADFDFKADIEGIFELEAHGPSGDVALAEIRVEPS
jgi:hypothetical protein